MVIEDDADWDVNFKSQLEDFSNATRALVTNQTQWDGTPSRRPYGDGWDLLWLGSCAVPAAGAGTLTFPGEGTEWPIQEHMVFKARGGLACTYGYAVNRRSARSLLGWLLDVDDPVDLAMSEWCEHKICIPVWPELIGMHRAAGSMEGDSDIIHGAIDNDNVGSSHGIREQGETRNVVRSAILDVLRRVGDT